MRALCASAEGVDGRHVYVCALCVSARAVCVCVCARVWQRAGREAPPHGRALASWQAGRAALADSHIGQLFRELVILQQDGACGWCKRGRGRAAVSSPARRRRPPADTAHCLAHTLLPSPRTPTVSELRLFHTGAPLLVVQCALLCCELGTVCGRGGGMRVSPREPHPCRLGHPRLLGPEPRPGKALPGRPTPGRARACPIRIHLSETFACLNLDL